MNSSGWNKNRFVGLFTDQFDCFFCKQIVLDPWECQGCGKLFCAQCISKAGKRCSNKCQAEVKPIFSKALHKMYNNLDIKCSNDKCSRTVKLSDLPSHEATCFQLNCWNYALCGKNQNGKISFKKPVCSDLCRLLYELKQSFGNQKQMYQIINKFHPSKSQMNLQPSDILPIAWDHTNCGAGLTFSDNYTNVFLNQQSYVFRSVIATRGFTSGINYWEIIADKKTQNQLKIGVVTNKNFDFNSAFCDHSLGFAFYGLAQLRHNSNASGPNYGKRFKKEGILGCCLNMDTGTLSFALNGQSMGVAFTDNGLKNGTIYPAVSLLHCAGCKIRSNMKIPNYFLN